MLTCMVNTVANMVTRVGINLTTNICDVRVTQVEHGQAGLELNSVSFKSCTTRKANRFCWVSLSQPPMRKVTYYVGGVPYSGKERSKGDKHYDVGRPADGTLHHRQLRMLISQGSVSMSRQYERCRNRARGRRLGKRDTGCFAG